MNKYVTTASVISKINSHEDLTEHEIDYIVTYVKSQPKLKIFAGVVKRMATTYNSLALPARVTLVRQFKTYLPSESYVGPQSDED
jgi:hypothetical protein